MSTNPETSMTAERSSGDDPIVVEGPRATIALPAYNEAEAIPSVVAEVLSVLGDEYEILVVDDGSSDGTAAVAKQAGARVLRHESNEGKGAAMATAARHARSDRLVFMDADATYPPDAIPALVESLDDHELCRADRSHDSANIPAINRIGNRVFTRLVNGFHGVSGDVLSGLYAIRADAFEQLELESVGFDVEVEIGIKSRMLGWRTDSVPIEYRSRIGDKKLSPGADGLRILTRIVGMLVLYRPVATFIVPGLVIMLAGLVGAVVLGDGPLLVGSLGFSVHSFVLATFGIITGLQLVILGVGAAAYRQDAGFTQSQIILRLTRRRARLTIAAVGGLLALGGAVWLSVLVIGWMADGAEDFTSTESLVFASASAVIGLQLMSAGIFLSIFAERPRRHAVLR